MSFNKIFLIFLLLSTGISWCLYAQQPVSRWEPKTQAGLSIQLYPAGIIPTVSLEKYHDRKSSFIYRLGGNFVDRQDFSDANDEEVGTGIGAGAGYRKHYLMERGKVLIGLNMDLWNLWVEWRDQIGTPMENIGSTYTLVLQPWVEAGYFLDFKNTNSVIGLTLGLGREFNVVTSGNDVAQGFIGSISIQCFVDL